MANDDTLEQLFDGPGGDRAAAWLAARALAVLDSPDVLDPLIDALLDAVILDPVADLETKRTPGDFSRHPIKTRRLHNLAEHETFADLMSLPTGATLDREGAAEIEYFLDFAARRARGIVLDVLRAEARQGLTVAPAEVRLLFEELSRRGELESFAGTVQHTLAVDENFDEFSLIEDLCALSFSAALRARRPDQASRLSKDEIRARRAGPERRYRLHLAQAIDSILQTLSPQLRDSSVTDINLLNTIIGAVQNIDGLDDIEHLGPLGLLPLLVRDERLLALLSKRGKVLLARNAARWLQEVENGERNFGHPLVDLYNALNFGVRLGEPAPTVVIRQGPNLATFNADNWPFFLTYALGPGDPQLDDRFEIIVARADSQIDPERAVEAVAGVVIVGNEANYLTAEEFRQGHGSDLMPDEAAAKIQIVDADCLCRMPGQGA